MKKTISLFLTIVMMLTLLSMPGNAMADEQTADVKLSTTKASLIQFDRCCINFTYGNGAQGELSFKRDNTNAYVQTVTSNNGYQYIYVVGLRVGKCKIKVYTKATDGSKKAVGTINVTVKKNKYTSLNDIKKQLKKEITVKQYVETEVRLLKKKMDIDGAVGDTWAIDFVYPKNCKISTEYKIPIGHNYICSRKKGTVKLKMYLYPRTIEDGHDRNIIKKGIYLGEMKVKTTAAKNNILKKNLTLRYQKEKCRQAFNLNWSAWDYSSRALGQKEFIKNLLGKKYDKKAAYTVRIEDSTIVKHSQHEPGYVNTDLFLYGYKPGKTTVKVFEKKPKKKSYVNIALINVTVDGNITLADISNKWYEEYEHDETIGGFDDEDNHLIHSTSDEKDLRIRYNEHRSDNHIYVQRDNRIYVLLDRTAPLYNTYRVQYTSLHPDYVTVEPDGTLEWKKDPKELTTPEMRTVPLISAKLTFVDGSEATYQFTYTSYY